MARSRKKSRRRRPTSTPPTLPWPTCKAAGAARTSPRAGQPRRRPGPPGRRQTRPNQRGHRGSRSGRAFGPGSLDALKKGATAEAIAAAQAQLTSAQADLAKLNKPAAAEDIAAATAKVARRKPGLIRPS